MASPELSRQHGAGSASARGLLLTLLGEFALPGGGVAWTSAVIAALARLGVEEKAARQALMRTSAAGWLAAERLGRRTRWHLTGAARELLAGGAERIYSFTGPAAEWDGRWLLVAARVPDTDRAARHALRQQLRWAGFGSLGPGLWISPRAERAAEAAEVLRAAGVAGAAQVFTAVRSGLGDPADMVAAAWDLAAIEAEYEQFIAAFSGPQGGAAAAGPAGPGDQLGQPDPPPGRRDPLARQVALVHAWRRFPAIDPGLPRELLPARWSGVTAARLFARRHAAWAADAQLEWKRLNQPG